MSAEGVYLSFTSDPVCPAMLASESLQIQAAAEAALPAPECTTCRTCKKLISIFKILHPELNLTEMLLPNASDEAMNVFPESLEVQSRVRPGNHGHPGERCVDRYGAEGHLCLMPMQGSRAP